MKLRMQVIFSLFLTLIFCGYGLAYAQENVETNALWQKAVLIAGLNENMVPGIMENHIEELDSKNQVVRYEDSQLRTYLDDGGEVQFKVVKVIDNGKDITATRQKAMAKERQVEKNHHESANQRKVSISLADSNPFKPEAQGNVIFKFLGFEDRNQMVCAAYQFTLKQKKGSIRGTAWLDQKTGTPVSIYYAPDPLPAFVTRMENHINYEYSSNGLWYPIELKMEGEGGILLIRKKIRVQTVFRDYWNRQQP